MSTNKLNKLILGAGLALILGVAGATVAQTINDPFCHHPFGRPNTHDQDSLLDNGVGHYDQTDEQAHSRDHPPVNGSCDLTGGTGDPVPEPITMLLFGAGLAGVGYAAKRRKRVQ